MTKLRAHNLSIRTVSKDEEIKFLNENHYQGFVYSDVCLGLYKDNELLELMSFGKPRYNRRYDWELLRLCTKKDYQVYGGASKLFNRFCINYNGSIISYCNKSLFSGNVYKSLGFISLGEVKSYHYEKDGQIYNRLKFQKHMLVKQGFDPLKTEREIMSERGYIRIDETQETFVYGVKWYIYRITNKINNKTYIGQHLDRCDDYWGSGTLIKRAIRKYGKDNFIKEIIVDNIKTQQEADKLEIEYIKKEQPIYNIRDGGHSIHPIFNTGFHHSHSDETKKIISLKSKELWNDNDYRAKQKESHKGKTTWNKGVELTKEHKDKLSESHKGKAPWNKGTKMTNEQKQKLSNSHKKVIYRCVETGEEHSVSEWKVLGFTNIGRPVCKGCHFERV